MTPAELIKAHILNELRWDLKVEAVEVGVIVKDGAVTLTGTVSSFPAKRSAEQATKRVKGIRAIAGKIDVAIVDGKVTLSGDVDGAFEKDLIEDAVWSAPGVMEVFNHLRVG